MDRVTKSFVSEFARSFGFDSVTDETVLFEHFVNYSIVEPKSEYRFDIDKVNIGKEGTIGIDGFAILLNKQLIESLDELEDFLAQHKRPTSEIVFIQSKTSAKFDSKEIGNFGFAVADFISESPKLRWSAVALDSISLFNAFVSRVSDLKENPTCSLYYVCLGNNENDQNVIARIKDIEENVRSENIFSKVTFDLVDASGIVDKYKRIGQSLERTFEFPTRVTLPVIQNIKESYVGVVDAKTIVDLMTDENGDLISNIFYDNVRDYQGGNKVNSEIAQTLQSAARDSFAILNNGITIIAESLRTTRDSFTLTNYQIINGCQTSHVLFDNRNYIDDSVRVTVKLVVSDNEELTTNVIRSTNRQTEVTEQDLLAFSKFQKRLEDYYGTFEGNQKLYYERRSKQYNNKPVERKRIIDKTTQIKAIGSLYYDKPDMATRYFGTLFSEFGDQLFKDNHEMFPYYVASYAIYRLEDYYKRGLIAKKYNKIKYHIITMIRREIDNSNCPPFESKKANSYAQKIFETLSSDEKLQAAISEVLGKIDSLNFDLDNNEISKSKEFVKQLLILYHVKRVAE